MEIHQNNENNNNDKLTGSDIFAFIIAAFSYIFPIVLITFVVMGIAIVIFKAFFN